MAVFEMVIAPPWLRVAPSRMSAPEELAWRIVWLATITGKGEGEEGAAVREIVCVPTTSPSVP